jgi:hypothetical protein
MKFTPIFIIIEIDTSDFFLDFSREFFQKSFSYKISRKIFLES